MYCLTVSIFYFTPANGLIVRTPSSKTWTKKTSENIFIKHRKILKPAYEHIKGGVKEWFYEGREYQIVETEFSTEIRSFVFTPQAIEYKLNSIADHPSVIYKNGTKEWHCFGFLSRTLVLDSPSVIYANGDKEWWQHGKRHRLKTNGPAVIYGNKQYWFENGEFQKCIV
ncbi:MAG: hypothetical protein EKK64_06615 [Neisseriaceae bacterium]|nr:MAG: hypothetical protein EKK64_06615 [Neisseriaceae bacterium]